MRPFHHRAVFGVLALTLLASLVGARTAEAGGPSPRTGGAMPYQVAIHLAELPTGYIQIFGRTATPSTMGDENFYTSLAPATAYAQQGLIALYTSYLTGQHHGQFGLNQDIVLFNNVQGAQWFYRLSNAIAWSYAPRIAVAVSGVGDEAYALKFPENQRQRFGFSLIFRRGSYVGMLFIGAAQFPGATFSSYSTLASQRQWMAEAMRLARELVQRMNAGG